MRRRVRGGSEVPLNDAAVIQSDDYDGFRPQLIVWNSARLDRHYTRSAIDTAGVAECEHNQAGANKLSIGSTNLLAKI